MADCVEDDKAKRDAAMTRESLSAGILLTGGRGAKLLYR